MKQAVIRFSPPTQVSCDSSALEPKSIQPRRSFYSRPNDAANGRNNPSKPLWRPPSHFARGMLPVCHAHHSVSYRLLNQTKATDLFVYKSMLSALLRVHRSRTRSSQVIATSALRKRSFSMTSYGHQNIRIAYLSTLSTVLNAPPILTSFQTMGRRSEQHAAIKKR